MDSHSDKKVVSGNTTEVEKTTLLMSDRLFPFLSKKWEEWEESMVSGGNDEENTLNYSKQKHPKTMGYFMRSLSSNDVEKEWRLTSQELTKNYKAKYKDALKKKKRFVNVAVDRRPKSKQMSYN